jgi:hypothetical protein
MEMMPTQKMKDRSINKHFRVEAKLMAWLFLAPIILGLLIAWLYPMLSHETNIDACLDSGGSFDYQTCKCDHEKTHPFEADNQCK